MAPFYLALFFVSRYLFVSFDFLYYGFVMYTSICLPEPSRVVIHEKTITITDLQKWKECLSNLNPQKKAFFHTSSTELHPYSPEIAFDSYAMLTLPEFLLTFFLSSNLRMKCVRRSLPGLYLSTICPRSFCKCAV